MSQKPAYWRAWHEYPRVAPNSAFRPQGEDHSDGPGLECRPDCAHLFDDDEDDEQAEWWEANEWLPKKHFLRHTTNNPERLTLNTRARKEVEVRQERGKSEAKTK